MRVHVRGRALVLVCALIAASCGGRTALQDYSTSSSGGAEGVGGGAPAGGGTGGVGGMPPGTGGAIGGTGGGPPVCKPGEWLVVRGEPGSPECLPCPDQWFSTTYSATTCEPWTECSWDQREIVPPTPSQDRVCTYGSSTRQFGTIDFDGAYDVAIDADGSVFVTGITYGSLDGASAGDADVFVREYSRSGQLVWAKQFGTAYYEMGTRLSLGYLSVPFVMTNRWSPYGVDTTVSTVNPYGDTIVGLFGEDGTDFTLGPDGSILLARTATENSSSIPAEITKLLSDGSTAWTTSLAAGDWVHPSDLELLSDGSFVVAGSTNGALFRPSSGIQEAFVAHLSKDGELDWGVQFGTGGWAHVRAVAVDSVGDVYAVGAWAATPDAVSTAMVAQVSPSGALLWLGGVGPDDSTVADLADVAIDGKDQVIATGVTYTTIEPSYDAQDVVVYRLLPDRGLGAGMQLGSTRDDWATAMAIAPDGGVFVVGMTNGTLGYYPEGSGGLDAFIHRIPPGLFDY